MTHRTQSPSSLCRKKDKTLEMAKKYDRLRVIVPPPGERDRESFENTSRHPQKKLHLDLSPSPNLSHKSVGSLTIEQMEWLTTDEAAEFLKIPPGSLRNMTSNGKIPFYKLGRSNRYLRRDLVELLLKNKRGISYGN